MRRKERDAVTRLAHVPRLGKTLARDDKSN